MSENTKFIIYQLLPRLFGNVNQTNKHLGTIHENGVGKFDDINVLALEEIKNLGVTHIWYTGIIEHATMTDYSLFDIPKDYPQIVKGRAGSPYAIKDYYDVDPDLAVDVNNRMTEFEALIDRTHNTDLKVIIDFIPNHLARNYNSDAKPSGLLDFCDLDDSTKAFDPDNNYYYLPWKEFRIPREVYSRYAELIINSDPYIEYPARATGNDCFVHNPAFSDWYETVKLNYGVDIYNEKQKHFDPIPATWRRMKEILEFWTKKQIDGFRCDMVEMVPVEFWAWVIPQIKELNPKLIFIGEIYKPQLYHEYLEIGKFDYLYDKEGLYDHLRLIMEGKMAAKSLSNVWKELNGLESQMLRFLENHDEQRIASKHFVRNPWKGIPAMIICSTMSKGPVMLYFGQELGESANGASGYSGDDGRTTIFDYWGMPSFQKWVNYHKYDGALLDESQREIRKKYQVLLLLCNENHTISNGNFYDLMWVNDDQSFMNPDHVYTYLRYTEEEKLLVVVNFSHEPLDVRVRIPRHAFDTIGINMLNTIYGRDILYTTQSFELEGGQVYYEGIPLHMEPNSGFIFKLECK
ncbi:MAG: alpha-amylase [Bacteroidales bacterium]|nr:alpha-amylase [Bacteroidales bacterium]